MYEAVNSEKQCIKIYNLYNSYKIYKFVAKRKRGREYQRRYTLIYIIYKLYVRWCYV